MWCCPSEADLGQNGAVLLIQGNIPKGKSMYFWQKCQMNILLFELADRQKWVCRSGTTGFRSSNQIHLSTTERYQHTVGGSNGSDWCRVSANQIWSKKWKTGKKMKWEQCLKLSGIKELVKDGVFLFLLLLQRKQKTPNLFRTSWIQWLPHLQYNPPGLWRWQRALSHYWKAAI